MVNIHDRDCRDFGVDQVFRLMVARLTMPTAFHGFGYSERRDASDCSKVLTDYKEEKLLEYTHRVVVV